MRMRTFRRFRPHTADRVLPRGVRPLLHHVAARGDRGARRGQAHGLVEDRPRLLDASLGGTAGSSSRRRCAASTFRRSTATRTSSRRRRRSARRSAARSASIPNYSGYIEETPAAFYMRRARPRRRARAPRPMPLPVYRLWNQRADSNHRYTTDPGIKAYMQSKNYVAEGYGADAVAMCTTQALLVDALVPTSGAVDVHARMRGVASAGTVYVNAEVEPSIAVNPANPEQHDRRVAAGPLVQRRRARPGHRVLVRRRRHVDAHQRADVAVLRRRGRQRVRARVRSVGHLCARRHRVSGRARLQQRQNGDNAIIVSRSTDGGRTWSAATTLRRDTGAFGNDKESITADPTDARYVYRGLGPPRRQQRADVARAHDRRRRDLGSRAQHLRSRVRTARRSTTSSSCCPTAR